MSIKSTATFPSSESKSWIFPLTFFRQLLFWSKMKKTMFFKYYFKAEIRKSESFILKTQNEETSTGLTFLRHIK